MATSTAADDGWAASADAWIKEQSDDGDYARRFVLDGPMVDRIRDRGFKTSHRSRPVLLLTPTKWA